MRSAVHVRAWARKTRAGRRVANGGNATARDREFPCPAGLGPTKVGALDTRCLPSRGQPFVLRHGVQGVAEICQGERAVKEQLRSRVGLKVMLAGRER